MGRDRDFNQFAAGDFRWTEKEVEAFMVAHDAYPGDHLTFHPGFFEATLKRHPNAAGLNAPAAIVNIDCDLYESTRLVLEFIEPLLQLGTIVLFDDWNCYAASPAHGERAAVREWLQKSTTKYAFESYAA